MQRKQTRKKKNMQTDKNMHKQIKCKYNGNQKCKKLPMEDTHVHKPSNIRMTMKGVRFRLPFEGVYLVSTGGSSNVQRHYGGHRTSIGT